MGLSHGIHLEDEKQEEKYVPKHVIYMDGFLAKVQVRAQVLDMDRNFDPPEWYEIDRHGKKFKLCEKDVVGIEPYNLEESRRTIINKSTET